MTSLAPGTGAAAFPLLPGRRPGADASVQMRARTGFACPYVPRRRANVALWGGANASQLQGPRAA